MSHGRAIPRYLVVGALCALVGNAILIAFDYLGIHYVVSCLVAFVITVVIAYGLHTHWTFGADRSVRGLIRYSAAMTMNLPLSLGLLFLLVTIGGLKMAFAAPAMTVLQTAFNYLVASTLIGRRSHDLAR